MPERHVSGVERPMTGSVLPKTHGDSRVSQTGFANILLDNSNPDKILTDEEERKSLR
ncbi:hypothetical protein DPMN_011788 [Dreissena polymorpha]|uniref:Uncharacterized protein n=2 Tax=Dreissena polymorpha TaxID=45954 RepID=A0A9D4N5T2_DREPO|nr:hypothetical protein DPMN_011788 [Dreissena polymorpha]